MSTDEKIIRNKVLTWKDLRFTRWRVLRKPGRRRVLTCCLNRVSVSPFNLPSDW